MESTALGLIDTHCHFNLPQFAADYPDAVRRAQEAGVSDMIVVGCDLGSSRLAIEMAEKYDCLWAAVGIHPCDAQDATDEAVAQISELATHPRVVAIGESGLDFVCEGGPPAEVQCAAFEQFIALAAELDKAFIIHSRTGATDDTVLDLLERTKISDQRVVRHCFVGDTALLERYLERECFISFAANVTYPPNHALRDAARAVPSERIVLETDCPGLPPQSHRGKRNEPALMAEMARKIAEIRGTTVEEMAALTTRNARRLYRLDT
jgi:TatD DNase family protein